MVCRAEWVPNDAVEEEEGGDDERVGGGEEQEAEEISDGEKANGGEDEEVDAGRPEHAGGTREAGQTVAGGDDKVAAAAAAAHDGVSATTPPPPRARAVALRRPSRLRRGWWSLATLPVRCARCGERYRNFDEAVAIFTECDFSAADFPIEVLCGPREAPPPPEVRLNMFIKFKLL